MKKSVKDMLAEANSCITTCEVDEAIALLERKDVVFVDVRDEPELDDSGKLPGAIHVSRGMLEFHIDPDSPYHDEVFDQNRSFVFYCKSGGRSALAAQQASEMGLAKVMSMNGGINAWLEKGGPIERK